MPRKGLETTGNASRILRAVYQHPRISRVAIAERLSLDKSTVTHQVNRLIQRGIIEEIEEGNSSAKGGRRPIHLSLSKRYGYCIGVELQVESWVAVAVDLTGEVLGEARGDCHIEAESLADTALAILTEAQARLRQEGRSLLGIGVGTGGLVNLRKSFIHFSVPLGITAPFDFGKAVASRLEVPCLIENDANCCAWGELAFNRDEALRDFLFALVEFRKDRFSLSRYGGMGVGFGIVLGGKVHPGAHGNAGEFRSAFCEGRGNLQFSLPREDLARIDRDRQALEKVSDELARNVAMLVNTMDFERVFIGGDLESLGVDFPGTLRRRLEENWMYPWPKDVKILNSNLRERAVAFGAAGMILDRLFSGRSAPGWPEASGPS